jgi:hypothetical protein
MSIKGVAMKKCLFAVLLCVSASSSFAADFGLGVSAKTNDGWIYVPIDLSAHVRLEPSVRYGRSKSHSSYVNEGSIFSPAQTANHSESHQTEVGLGLFGVSPLGTAVKFYYGARAAYIDGEGRNDYTNVYDAFYQTEETVRQSFDGYRLAPTLGIQYALTEHFSLGAEASLAYEKIDGDIRDSYVSVEGSDVQSTGSYGQSSTRTESFFIVRYMF